MKKRRLGKTDMNVSVLGFGGSEIGYERASPETVAELLNSGLNAGLNVIDTAECYYNSEELIGEAVSHRRKEFYLFTKCGHPHGFGERADWSKSSILESIERSLRRLKTDKIDIVQLHSCSETELRKGEAIEALQTARDRGYIRYLGYSGDSHAARFAVETGAFDTRLEDVTPQVDESMYMIPKMWMQDEFEHHGLIDIPSRPIHPKPYQDPHPLMYMACTREESLYTAGGRGLGALVLGFSGPDEIAKKNALDYYAISYQQRGKIGGMQAAYYSEECAPGKAMDEHLSDSTWSAP